MESVNPVLARKLGLTETTSPAEDAPAAASPMRMMRRSLARAADKAVGMSASFVSLSEDMLEAEKLIETSPDGWVVLGLREANTAGLSGLFLIDPRLRSGLIEMQTMGSLLPLDAEQRPVTRTDMGMCVPFAQRWLSELDDLGFAQPEVELGGYDFCPMADLRTASLVMMQGGYRMWRVTLGFGGGDSEGEILLAVLPKMEIQDASAPLESNWSQNMRDAVGGANAQLDAVLTRMVMSISAIEAFEVGQVLSLPGTTVGSVTVRGPGGEKVGTARLGQVAGKRAIRIEAPHVELEAADPAMQSSMNDAMAGMGGGVDLEPEPMAAMAPMDLGGLPGEDALPQMEDPAAMGGVDLSEADLGGADLGGADLGEVDLGEVDLGEVDFSGAAMGEVDLSGALDGVADDEAGEIESGVAAINSDMIET